jgi:drug/metabolite transporter (DMT)-like permease
MPHCKTGAAPNRLAVIAAFASTYIIWGSTYLAIRYAVETIPPLYAASTRHLVAGSILLAWCLAKRLRPTWEQFRASAVIGFLFFLLGHGSLHWAETRVPTGEASLLIASEPILVFVIASVAMRKWRVNVSLLAGVFLGLAAVGLLMGHSLLVAAPGMALGGFAILFRRYGLVGGNRLFPAIKTIGKSVVALRAFATLRVGHAGDYGDALRRVSRLLAGVGDHALLVGVGVLGGVWVGDYLHRLQLVAGALLAHTGLDAHLRESYHRGAARLVAGGREGHLD